MDYCERRLSLGSMDLEQGIKDPFLLNQYHHSSYTSFRDSAAGGCPLCNILYKDWIEKEMRVFCLDEHHVIRHHVFRDMHAPSPFIINFLTRDYLFDSLGGVSSSGYDRLVFQRKFESSSIRYGDCQLRSWSSFLEFRLVSLAGGQELVPGRQIERFLNFDLALSWIQECSQKHKKCGDLRDMILPRRLIDVGEAGVREPKLIETESRRGQYLTLSHRWGKSQPFVTTRRNYEAHVDSIPFESLPQTFQDAITATRKLGFRLLWIDCLCILQDDNEDWARECTQMETIYERSACCIAAAAATSAYDGFLHPRPEAEGDYYRFPSSTAQEIEQTDIAICRATIPIHENYPKEVESPLTNRGWVLQERFLPPRVLYIGTAQAYFECRTAEFSECCRYSLTRSHYHSDPPLEKKILDWEQPYGEACKLWRHIIQVYSNCFLSKRTDKLPALCGLARRFSERFNDHYLAGLFQGDLATQLLWTADPREDQVHSGDTEHLNRFQSPLEYIAPSWSWASIEHPVTYSSLYMGEYMKIEMEVESANIELKTLNPFGEIIARAVLARAYISPMKMRALLRYGRVNEYDCTLSDGPHQGFSYFVDAVPLDRDAKEFEVLCLLVTYGEHHGHESWAGLVIEPENDKLGTYRRIGLLYYFGPSSKEDYVSIWDDAPIQTITLV